MCEHGYYIYLIYMAVKCAVKNTITYEPAYYKGHQANLTQGNICQTISNYSAIPDIYSAYQFIKP